MVVCTVLSVVLEPGVVPGSCRRLCGCGSGGVWCSPVWFGVVVYGVGVSPLVVVGGGGGGGSQVK